jgi:secondary thiamine-phosphate synthase enzyme
MRIIEKRKSFLRGVPRTSKQWIRYFERNQRQLLRIPWEENEAISQVERNTIAKSISIFQLGENSDGNRFKKAGAEYQRRFHDADFLQALELFIGEERRHASYLARFMELEQIPVRQHHWTDSVFRCARRFWNLEICILVLMAAELIAKVYYRALRDATSSTILRAICTQLLRDEVHHIYFQTATLAKIRKGRSSLLSALFAVLYRTFFAGTLIVVWRGHSAVFRKSSYSFRRFWKKSFMHYRHAIQLIQRGHKRKRRIRFWSKQITYQTGYTLEFIDMTEKICDAIRASKIDHGILTIHTLHTTTAILINENEPLLLEDLKRTLEKLVPQNDFYRHDDFSIRTVNMTEEERQNGHSHCKAMLLPTCASLNIVNRRLRLGRWQRIFLVELDRARKRSVSLTAYGATSGS